MCTKRPYQRPYRGSSATPFENGSCVDAYLGVGRAGLRQRRPRTRTAAQRCRTVQREVLHHHIRPVRDRPVHYRALRLRQFVESGNLVLRATITAMFSAWPEDYPSHGPNPANAGNFTPHSAIARLDRYSCNRSFGVSQGAPCRRHHRPYRRRFGEKSAAQFTCPTPSGKDCGYKPAALAALASAETGSDLAGSLPPARPCPNSPLSITRARARKPPQRPHPRTEEKSPASVPPTDPPIAQPAVESSIVPIRSPPPEIQNGATMRPCRNGNASGAFQLIPVTRL